jgi:hypothetical protein
VTNFAAGIAALIVVAGAGYLGAMSGRPQATTTGSPPAETTTVAKVDPPPPPTATAAPPPAPSPAPTPTATAEPPRAREVAPEPRRATSDEEAPRPRRTTSDEETPRPRRTTSDEEAPRPRATGDNPRPSRTHAPKPAGDEESGGNTPPETRLPDSNEPPPQRPTIDQGALRAAFAEGEAKARACLGAASPSGTARFSVTFAPSGEAVAAIVSGAPFANTLEGQCMAGKFRTLHVPPFTGGEVIVRKSINFQ